MQRQRESLHGTLPGDVPTGIGSTAGTAPAPVTQSTTTPSEVTSSAKDTMTETLPLFAESRGEGAYREAGALDEYPVPRHDGSLVSRAEQRIASARDSRESDDRHLAAARRLSRRMRKLRDRSPEETRAGLQICRHLRALLTDADNQPGNPPRSH